MQEKKEVDKTGMEVEFGLGSSHDHFYLFFTMKMMDIVFRGLNTFFKKKSTYEKNCIFSDVPRRGVCKGALQQSQVNPL